jgi:hypothetical protein
VNDIGFIKDSKIVRISEREKYKNNTIVNLQKHDRGGDFEENKKNALKSI